MRLTRSRALIATLAAAVLAGGGVAVAGQGGDDEDAGEVDRSITGAALDSASAAALAHTGGGRVTETEVGDEEGYYEVEVTRADGSQVDVHLDRGFRVLGQAGDDDRDAADEPGDD